MVLLISKFQKKQNFTLNTVQSTQTLLNSFWVDSLSGLTCMADLCSTHTGVRVCGSDNGTLLKSVYLNPQNTLSGKSVSFQPNGSDLTLTHIHKGIETVSITKGKNVFSSLMVICHNSDGVLLGLMMKLRGKW